ncbi:MAG: hypothetical protein AUJ12_08400 [Alphaproteobacteria bacterium CG1_02_46_17]|nr:MAG: hypothetical protein AUJ12_08400 [Alphaproteobacteria bacterium CG1_02_46_17]
MNCSLTREFAQRSERHARISLQSDLSYSVEPGRTSQLEAAVAQLLERLDARVYEQMEIAGLNHPLDLSAVYKDKSFHIECDGCTHLVKLCNGKEMYLNGRTMFQSGLIQRVVKAPLVRLPSYVFGQNKRNMGYWKEFLDQVIDVPERTSLMLLGTGRPELMPINVNCPI